jgi:hypothetical protein
VTLVFRVQSTRRPVLLVEVLVDMRRQCQLAASFLSNSVTFLVATRETLKANSYSCVPPSGCRCFQGTKPSLVIVSAHAPV